MVRTVDTDIIIVILVGVLSELQVIQPLVDSWVALGTGKNSDFVVSKPFVIPSVQNQELSVHLLAAILHQPSEVRAKYQLGKPNRHMKSLQRH